MSLVNTETVHSSTYDSETLFSFDGEIKYPLQYFQNRTLKKNINYPNTYISDEFVDVVSVDFLGTSYHYFFYPTCIVFFGDRIPTGNIQVSFTKYIGKKSFYETNYLDHYYASGLKLKNTNTDQYTLLGNFRVLNSLSPNSLLMHSSIKTLREQKITSYLSAVKLGDTFYTIVYESHNTIYFAEDLNFDINILKTTGIDIYTNLYLSIYASELPTLKQLRIDELNGKDILGVKFIDEENLKIAYINIDINKVSANTNVIVKGNIYSSQASLPSDVEINTKELVPKQDVVGNLRYTRDYITLRNANVTYKSNFPLPYQQYYIYEELNGTFLDVKKDQLYYLITLYFSFINQEYELWFKEYTIDNDTLTYTGNNYKYIVPYGIGAIEIFEGGIYYFQNRNIVTSLLLTFDYDIDPLILNLKFIHFNVITKSLTEEDLNLSIEVNNDYSSFDLVVNADIQITKDNKELVTVNLILDYEITKTYIYLNRVLIDSFEANEMNAVKIAITDTGLFTRTYIDWKYSNNDHFDIRLKYGDNDYLIQEYIEYPNNTISSWTSVHIYDVDKVCGVMVITTGYPYETGFIIIFTFDKYQNITFFKKTLSQNKRFFSPPIAFFNINCILFTFDQDSKIILFDYKGNQTPEFRSRNPIWDLLGNPFAFAKLINIKNPIIKDNRYMFISLFYFGYEFLYLNFPTNINNTYALVESYSVGNEQLKLSGSYKFSYSLFPVNPDLYYQNLNEGMLAIIPYNITDFDIFTVDYGFIEGRVLIFSNKGAHFKEFVFTIPFMFNKTYEYSFQRNTSSMFISTPMHNDEDDYLPNIEYVQLITVIYNARRIGLLRYVFQNTTGYTPGVIDDFIVQQNIKMTKGNYDYLFFQ